MGVFVRSGVGPVRRTRSGEILRGVRCLVVEDDPLIARQLALLLHLEGAETNAFVKNHVALDSWIGADDVTTEGTWVWTFGGSTFWTGTASGQAVDGLYTNWSAHQPDNLGNQDCGKMQVLDGAWTDESCGLALQYVCESGTDQCPNDPEKVLPGACGCGASDVDTDHDGTADCNDACPNDPTKIRPGDCGCADAPAVSGTPCSDGLCAANTACDGHGVCGAPSVCPAPDSTCRFAAFQNAYYWFCDNDRSFADGRQRCQNLSMDVVAIESAAEDTFINSHTLAGDHTFLGGTDQASEGNFIWLATNSQFWTGGTNGSAVSGAYSNWEKGEPSGSPSNKDCMFKDPSNVGGQWETTSCTTNEGYVCERIDLCPTNPAKLVPGQCGCANPDTDTDHDGVADCVDGCPVDAHKTQPGICGCGAPDVDTDGDGLLDCQDGCPSDPTNAACSGALPPILPPFTNPGATPSNQTPVDQSTCNPEQGALAPVDPPITDPNDPRLAALVNQFHGTPGEQCARVQDPEACPFDPTRINDPNCSADSDCPAGFVCGKGIPTSCATEDPATPGHKAKCSTETLHCGVPNATCATHPAPQGCNGTCACADPSSPSCPCTEYTVCSLPNATGDSGPGDPHAWDPEPPPTMPIGEITSKQAPPPTPTYADPPDSCPQAVTSGNCWCALEMNTPGAVTVDHGRDASHGAGSFLSMEFKPDVHFDATVTPLPFGEASFQVDAGASFQATAGVKFLTQQPQTIDLVSLNAGVHADRCSMASTASSFKVLGVDFVDLFGAQPFDSSSMTTDPNMTSHDCELAVDHFIDAGNRAKKALRDVQVILDNYKTLPAGHTFNKTSFCLASQGTRVPPLESPQELDFPPAAPGTTCETVPVEATINRYIDYYTLRVQDLRDAISGLDQASAVVQSALNGDSSSPGDIPFLHVQHEDSLQFAKIQFFVGPIPVLITMDAALDYGVNGDLDFRFTPTSGLGLTTGQATQLVAATANLVPSVTASVDLFAGVGIDLGIFSISAGIEGQLILAAIQANLKAGTGLSLAATPDTRGDDPQNDLRSLGTGNVFFPEREYNLYLDWFYGADIALTNVLKANLNARVELSALFFSETFRKTVLTMPGFNLPAETLLHGGGQLSGRLLPVAGDVANTLGNFAMQLPFVEILPRIVPATDTRTADASFVLPPGEGLHFDDYCNIPPVP